jgi:hypothetical protein
MGVVNGKTRKICQNCFFVAKFLFAGRTVKIYVRWRENLPVIFYENNFHAYVIYGNNFHAYVIYA